jgi:cytoskeletal protein CcmA (bactofilin family)
MFGGKKDKEQETVKQIQGSPQTVNIISAGTEIEGKVIAETDIRIDGRFKGDLICKSRIIIGPSGQFQGSIQCVNAVIEGSFNGELKVKELLEVKDNGKLNGNIQTNKLIVQAGAVFDVNCSMGVKSSSATTQNNPNPNLAKVTSGAE